MLARIKYIARRRGYKIYREPFKLNIWGIRSRSVVPNRFDDELHVFYNSSKGVLAKWIYFVFKCTTDPGTYWLRNPLQPQGTAMLAPGQYVDTYKIDLHRGKYYALCQRLRPVVVIRDYNRNAILDFYNGRKDRGMHGVNIHRASKSGITYEVDKYSAGCQVFQKANEFDFFMKLCEMHKRYHGNVFTYTLIDLRMEFRQSLKRMSIGLFSAGVLIGGYWWLNGKEELKIA